MKFIDDPSDDSIFALILARPNRSTHPRLTLEIPFTETDRAISAREARRAFGRSSRYTLEYAPWLKNAGMATEFRIGLERLHAELVAVPLWDDVIVLNTGCSASATSLQKTSLDPARFGAKWLVMSPTEPSTWSGFVYEIITVTGISGNTVTVASPGMANAWPAGTLLYPLLYGRLEDRPQLDSRTPQKVTGVLKIREDSAFSQKINVYNGVIPTVGSNIAAFSGYPIWDVEPAWVQVLDTTEVDLILEQIGFLRQRQKYVYQQPVRRGLEMEFVCSNRSTIAAIEKLFVDRKGPVRPFMVPTFRQDLVITQDLPISGNTNKINIQSSEYSDPLRPAHPGDPFFALLQPGQVDPVKVTTVVDTQLTVAVAIAQSHSAARTRMSHLLLACFGGAEISWEYSKPTRARVRIRFLEKTDEYATPATNVVEPAYLYKFTHNLPTPVHWYYTSYEDTITFASQAYTPAPFSHGSIKSGIKLEKEETNITSWGGDFPGNPLAKLFPFTLEGSLDLEIIEVNVAAPNDAFAKTIFKGAITKPEMVGKDWKVTARWGGTVFDRNIPRFIVQKPCNVAVYSTKCGVDREDFKVSGTFHGSPASNTTILVNGGTDKEEDYFAGGFCECGTGDTFERRVILHSEVVSGNLQLVLERRFNSTHIDGAAIYLFPGCNQSIEMCIGRFDNQINFRGHPYIPTKNPSANIGEVSNQSGGKKG